MSEEPLFSDKPAVVSIEAETQFAPNGIVSRTLFRSAHTRVVLFGFSEGQELSEHSSTQHALVQMLSGEAEWTLAGETSVLGAGDLLYMPPRLPHAVKALSEFSMLLMLTRDGTVSDRAGDAAEAIAEAKVFDVRSIPCPGKHSQILDRWSSLAVGDYFVLKNDHDPVPLRYQFEAEFPGAVAWEYVERGPGVFQVKITKLSETAGRGSPISSDCGSR